MPRPLHHVHVRRDLGVVGGQIFRPIVRIFGAFHLQLDVVPQAPGLIAKLHAVRWNARRYETHRINITFLSEHIIKQLTTSSGTVCDPNNRKSGVDQSASTTAATAAVAAATAGAEQHARRYHASFTLFCIRYFFLGACTRIPPRYIANLTVKQPKWRSFVAWRRALLVELHGVVRGGLTTLTRTT